METRESWPRQERAGARQERAGAHQERAGASWGKVSWNFVKIHEFLRSSRILIKFVKFPRIPLDFMDFHELQWHAMKFNGNS